MRRSTPEDLESFWRCLDAVARERKWLAFLKAPSFDDVRSFLSQNPPIQFVAVQQHEVVGWCDITPSSPLKNRAPTAGGYFPP
ncbi:MAG: GNAT family N-acetyltransferase, partial [Candidatus Binatia bacterium]